jgi:hypothetical protein
VNLYFFVASRGQGTDEATQCVVDVDEGQQRAQYRGPSHEESLLCSQGQQRAQYFYIRKIATDEPDQRQPTAMYPPDVEWRAHDNRSHSRRRRSGPEGCRTNIKRKCIQYRSAAYVKIKLTSHVWMSARRLHTHTGSQDPMMCICLVKGWPPRHSVAKQHSCATGPHTHTPSCPGWAPTATIAVEAVAVVVVASSNTARDEPTRVKLQTD